MISDIRWQRVNDDGFEYAIQQGPHGDEFVKLLDGSCLCRNPGETGRLTDENEKLRAALKPFAVVLTRNEILEPSNPGNLLECCREDITLYEFAQARTALERKTAP